MIKVCYFLKMNRPFIDLFVIFSSLCFLGACAGRPEFQKTAKDTFPSEPAPINLEETQKKSPPSNPRAYYFFLLSQLKSREGTVDAAIEDLKQAVARDAKEPSLHVELATLY